MIFDIDSIEEIIGYSFKDKMLLRQCITHSSYVNEHGGLDNELLEFFGDSVLQFIATEFLFKNALGDEGKLTDKRKLIVSKEPLLRAVKKLNICDYVLLGKGQIKNFSQDEKLYSSLYEALVAGIYLDGGIINAKKFIKRTLLDDFVKNEKKEKQLRIKKFNEDYKSRLQEYVQQNKMGSISYELLSSVGPAHKPQFKVAVLINSTVLAEATGSSKKNAQNEAAGKALSKLSKKTKNQGR